MSNKVFAVAQAGPNQEEPPMMDYVKEFLEKHGVPLIRESYIRLNWPGRDLDDEPLSGEELAELPEEIQIQSEGGWIN